MKQIETQIRKVDSYLALYPLFAVQEKRKAKILAENVAPSQICAMPRHVHGMGKLYQNVLVPVQDKIKYSHQIGG